MLPAIGNTQVALGQQPRNWELLLDNGIASIYIDRSSIQQRLGQARVLVMMDYPARGGAEKSSFGEWIFRCARDKAQYRISYAEGFSGSKLSGHLTQGGRAETENWVDVDPYSPVEKVRSLACR